MSYSKTFIETFRKKFIAEPEFVQAVEEFIESISDLVDADDRYKHIKILERLTIPDRIISFKVEWTNTQGNIEINTGYRVQFNNLLGVYKGGLRFHPTVNISILKFLGFEQIFKNALTGLPMGGAKGGSDFDPKDRSKEDIELFVRAFAKELSKHIGFDVDVPAGDIGVGSDEIRIMVDEYSKQTGKEGYTFTGKPISLGGSELRTEATGYGVVYFLQEAIKYHEGIDSISGKNIIISGSGNVALYAAEKCIELGANVVTMSDSSGYIYEESGITKNQLDWIKNLKEVEKGRISEYLKFSKSAKFIESQKPWAVKDALIALPCATQNEIELEDSRELVSNNVKYVVEGSNMSTSNSAIELFKRSNVIYIPGKASNAGGVSVSGLEIEQNKTGVRWSRKEVDAKLKSIIKSIHSISLKYGKSKDYVDYQNGANNGAFEIISRKILNK